jgi:N-acetylmuramic acid 6-phosphate (MurNAc-6-P) etherase
MFIAAGKKPKVAILMVLLGIDVDSAQELLTTGLGRISEAQKLHLLRAKRGEGRS